MRISDWSSDVCSSDLIVICGPSHVDQVTKDLTAANITDARIIVEPAARNTAPAIALAAELCGSQSLMLVMPADHVMTDVAAFLTAIELALPAVLDGALDRKSTRLNSSH